MKKYMKISYTLFSYFFKKAYNFSDKFKENGDQKQ